MKVAFLTTRLEKPSARYRFLQYVPYLEDEGFSIKVFIIPARSLERRRMFKGLGGFDLVVLQKRTFGALDWRALRKNATRIIYDFDDAVMFVDSNKGGGLSSARFARFVRIVKGSDAVIAGNAYLKEWALKYNSDTVVIPTPVDLRRYALKDDCGAGSDIVRLGWIGSASTLVYLESLRPVLDELSARHPNTGLTIVADKFFDCARMPVQKKQWNYDEEIVDLHGFDIGLMPLAGDEWSRGKCGFKLLQYMAVGVCPVASPVGVNSEIISSGTDGFLASNDKEWLEKLSILVEDASLRKSIGREARKKVIKKYSLEVALPMLINVLRGKR